MDRLEQDELCPYLYKRHTGTSVSWIFYKTVGGRPRKQKIGDILFIPAAEAREHAKRILDVLQVSQLELRRQETLTVGCAFEQYFDVHVQFNNSRPLEVQQAFDKHWKSIKDVPVKQLTSLQIEKWKNELKRIGEPTANRQLNQLRACVNWAIKNKLVILDDNPTVYVKNFPMVDRTEYLRPGDEFLRLKRVLDDHPGDVADVIWLLLHTAARKSNVLALRWCDLDLQARVWIIPAKINKVWNTKTRRNLRVPLTNVAVEILTRRQLVTQPSEWVFPSPKNVKKHRRNIDTEWRILRKLADLDRLRLQDFRHTLPSWMGINNSSAFVIQKLLGHANVSMTAKYTELSLDPVRSQMQSAVNSFVG